jgi:hypothetical protein
LEEIDCRLSKTKDRPSAGRVKVSDADVKQVLNEDEYYDDESIDEKRTQLLILKQRDLPCPQEYRQEFEHPSTKEFISIDFISSWIGSSSAVNSIQITNQVKSILVVALTSHFACTVAAFFR